MTDINRALKLHQAGRLEEAEVMYRQILAKEPEQADALHLLGIIALQTGHHDTAVDYLGKAVERRPQVPDYHYNLGLALAGLGKAAEAAHHFHQAIALNPDFAEAHNNLGNALKEQGQIDEALACYQRALALYPDYAAAQSNLGVILLDRGDTQGAIEHYQRAIAIDPSDADSQYNLANALRATGRLNEAVSTYRKAIELRADFFDAYVNLGTTLKDFGALDAALDAYEQALALDPRSTAVWIQLGNVSKGQGKTKDAIERYERAIDIDPGCAEAHYNLGNALREAGDLVQAIAVLKRAIALKPDFAEAYSNLGDVLWECGRLGEALAVLQQALALRPDLSRAHNNLGNVLKAQGRLGEAVAAYRQALALKPGFPEASNNLAGVLQAQGEVDAALAAYRQALALNPDFVDAHSNLLLCLHYGPTSDATELFTEHRRWGERHAAPLASMIPVHGNARESERRLRIGYVSPDFRAHSVSHFIAPVLAAHERRHYEVYCYYNLHQVDATTERLRGLADHWRDIAHLSDAEATERVREDGIDILVDLAGHTANNRLLLFARKPAPVQVAYLGYPDTRGFAAIDYWLSDAHADPLGEAERCYIEQVIRLPRGFNCYQPPLDSPSVNPLPALSMRYVTFGSFNNLAKLNDWTVALWSQILKRLLDTRLVLKAQCLGDQETRERIQQRFAEHGVGPERLELLGAFAVAHDHLKAYHRIDIALDTFPYNGHTTTCEALWMGIPVITLAGKTHAGRVGVSLLTQVGLPELIAESREHYVALAVELAQDLPRLQVLRQSLRERVATSPLCDAKGFTHALEAAYRGMWRRWRDETQASPTPTNNPASSNGQMSLSVRIPAGVSLVLPDSVQFLTTYVLLEQEDWFEDELAFVRHLLRPGMHTLDIGASYGVYSATMAKLIGPSGKVWAFEPARSPGAFLRKSIEQNRLSNIVLNHIALSNRTGEARLKLNPQSELNSLADKQSSQGDQETVELGTLDQCLRTYGWQGIDFVKMDAEGEEVRIVEGGEQFFAVYSPLVLFELKHGDEFNWSLLRQFSRIGYDLYRLVPGLEMLAPFDPERDVDPWQLNLFACKPDRARSLEKQGLLVREQVAGKGGCSQAQQTWLDLFRLWPYAMKQLNAWTTTKQSKRAQGHDRYLQALDRYAQAHAQDLPLGTRLDALRQCLIELQQASALEDSCCRLQSLARVAWEFGERRMALIALERLIHQLGKGTTVFDEPFLTVCKRFQAIDPEGELQQWCLAAALEQREKLQSFSSYFSGRESLPSLEFARTLPFYGAEMERRRQLIRMRYGIQTGPEMYPLLASESDDNLNPKFWTKSH